MAGVTLHAYATLWFGFSFSFSLAWLDLPPPPPPQWHSVHVQYAAGHITRLRYTLVWLWVGLPCLAAHSLPSNWFRVVFLNGGVITPQGALGSHRGALRGMELRGGLYSCHQGALVYFIYKVGHWQADNVVKRALGDSQ